MAKRTPFGHSLPYWPPTSMAVVLNFATFKGTVLKKIDDVFPDRLAQMKEQERIISEAGDQGSSAPYSAAHEATILASFLLRLREIQRRTSPFSAPYVVEEEALQMTQHCEETNFNLISRPVQAQIESVLQHYNALCLYHVIFTLHTHIYANSAKRTSTNRHSLSWLNTLSLF